MGISIMVWDLIIEMKWRVWKLLQFNTSYLSLDPSLLSNLLRSTSSYLDVRQSVYYLVFSNQDILSFFTKSCFFAITFSGKKPAIAALVGIDSSLWEVSIDFLS